MKVGKSQWRESGGDGGKDRSIPGRTNGCTKAQSRVSGSHVWGRMKKRVRVSNWRHWGREAVTRYLSWDWSQSLLISPWPKAGVSKGGTFQSCPQTFCFPTYYGLNLSLKVYCFYVLEGQTTKHFTGFFGSTKVSLIILCFWNCEVLDNEMLSCFAG